MRILAFSDWRVQNIDALVEYVQSLDYAPDLIIYAGDDVGRFNSVSFETLAKDGSYKVSKSNRTWTLQNDRLSISHPDGKIGNSKKNYFEILAQLSAHGLCAVIGNDDWKISQCLIQGRNVFNVETKPQEVGDFIILGLGGAPSLPGVYVYSEDRAKNHLLSQYSFAKGKKIILVTHTPPHKILDRAIRFGDRNIGSKEVLNFITTHKKVILTICGHVHSKGGQTQKYGDGLCINCASHDGLGSPGRIAHITIDKKGKTDVNWLDLFDGGEIQLVPLIGIRAAELLNLHGIKRIAQMADFEITDELRKTAPKWFITRFPLFKNYARAIATSKTIIKGTHPFFNQKHKDLFFCDLEYDPHQSEFGVFLIGIMDQNNQVKQYFLEDPQQEEQLLKNFEEWLIKNRPRLVGFGSDSADKPQLIKAFSRFGLKTEILENLFFDLYYDCINTQRLETQHLFLPMKGSAGLKQVSEYFGYTKPQNLRIHDGLHALGEYRDFLNNKKAKTKRDILAYNKTDLESTKLVYDKLFEIFNSKKDKESSY